MKKYLNGLSIVLLTFLFLAACSTKTEVVRGEQTKQIPAGDVQKENSAEKVNVAPESTSTSEPAAVKDVQTPAADQKQGEQVKTTTTEAVSVSPSPQTEQVDLIASGTKEFSITAQQWQFTPSKITVKKGDKVKITLTSKDVTHGFNLPAYGIDEQIQKDKNTVVEFTADKSGTFPFACSVFCGSGHGKMAGTLVVEQ